MAKNGEMAKDGEMAKMAKWRKNLILVKIDI